MLSKEAPGQVSPSFNFAVLPGVGAESSVPCLCLGVDVGTGRVVPRLQKGKSQCKPVPIRGCSVARNRTLMSSSSEFREDQWVAVPQECTGQVASVGPPRASISLLLCTLPSSGSVTSEAVSCGLAGGLHQPSEPTCSHSFSRPWEQGCC